MGNLPHIITLRNISQVEIDEWSVRGMTSVIRQYSPNLSYNSHDLTMDFGSFISPPGVHFALICLCEDCHAATTSRIIQGQEDAAPRKSVNSSKSPVPLEANDMTQSERTNVEHSSVSRGKFIIGGLMILAALIYLIVASTSAAAQYYLTIDELITKGEEVKDRNLKISGAVDGDTIRYDAETLTLQFTLVNIPADLDEIEQAGGLAEVLYRAVNDPTATRLQVEYYGPKPDLLRDEAQAIVTGHIGDDGVFYADELLLKCPTRYEDEVPLQAGEG
jgi:cytochrome c-type biogenesis protein CcmE